MDIYEKIVKCKQNNINAMVVTAVSKQGEGPVEVGKKMLVTETGEALGTVGGGALEFHAREKCKTLIKARKHLHERYVLNDGKIIPDAKTLPMVCGGVVTLYYEYIGAERSIYIFGAGHVGQALVNTLKPLNFHLTVIDEREHVVKQFRGADRLVHKNFVEFIEDEGIKEDSFIVVCTPSHEHDYHVINKVLELKLNPAYMGMLCSSKKLKEYLESTYQQFGKSIDLSHFYAPIGLSLGGGSPEAIAISIASELLAIHHGKTTIDHMRETENGHNHYWKN